MIVLLISTVVVAAISANAVAPIILVIVALLGSGGLGYFLDRRSAQASRLANDAVNATTVFQRSLDEERLKRAALDADLAAARLELSHAMASSSQNTELIQQLHQRVQALENDLLRGFDDMNNIIGRMFQDPDQTEEVRIERWRNVMQATRLSVIQTDHDVVIVFISEECGSLLGYDLDELIGQPVYQIIDPDYHALFKRTLRAATRAQDHSSEPITLCMVHKDGTLMQMLVAIGVHATTITLLIRPTVSEMINEEDPSEESPCDDDEHPV